MPDWPISFGDGDAWKPSHAQMVFDELRRLRKMKGIGNVRVDHAMSESAAPIIKLIGQADSGIFRAVVTTAIPTGTIDTPSTTGEVTLYTWDGTTSAAGETGVKVCNDFTISASVPVDTVVKVAFIDDDYWLVSSECF